MTQKFVMTAGCIVFSALNVLAGVFLTLESGSHIAIAFNFAVAVFTALVALHLMTLNKE